MATQSKDFIVSMVYGIISNRINLISAAPKGAYIVLHPYDGSLNDSFYQHVEYKPVFVTAGDSLEDVFRQSQNEDETYSQQGYRSTSIGDIILRCDDVTTYIVKGNGFEEVPFSWYTYVDVKNHTVKI